MASFIRFSELRWNPACWTSSVPKSAKRQIGNLCKWANWNICFPFCWCFLPTMSMPVWYSCLLSSFHLWRRMNRTQWLNTQQNSCDLHSACADSVDFHEISMNVCPQYWALRQRISKFSALSAGIPKLESSIVCWLCGRQTLSDFTSFWHLLLLFYKIGLAKT